MNKKLAVVSLVVLCLLVTPSVSLANASSNFSFTVGSPKYVKDGQSKTMEVSPFIKDGRTYMPVRNLADALDIDVEWDAATQTVKLNKNGKNVHFKMGSKVMTVDGVNKQMDVYPEIINNRVVLPFRWVAQAFDTEINWDENARTISRGDQSWVQNNSWNAPLNGVPNNNNPANNAETGLSDIEDILNDYFADAGYDYFYDEGIDAAISLDGDKDNLAYKVTLDFDDAEDYDDLKDISETRLKNFLNRVKEKIILEINDTGFEGAGIKGKAVDKDNSALYVQYNGDSYTFSWDE